MNNFVDLKTWWYLNYGDAYCAQTVRRWCQKGLIFPTPEKHGGKYKVFRNAKYINKVVELKPKLKTIDERNKINQKLQQLLG